MFPWESTAVQVTVLTPSGQREPGAGVNVGVTGRSTRSTALAENGTGAPAALFAAAVMSLTVIAGGVVSPTATLKLAVVLLPAWSVAVQDTVVVPIGNREPEAGLQFTATVPSTGSLAT